MKAITRTVWVLSLVSLLTDTASEMLYPIIPIYLQTIGFSVLLIGVLEGFAEAIAGLSKGYFGKLSDVTGKRTPFVQLGYLLSAISRPLMAMFTWPLWVFMARTMDRFGKGLRTGARDALLSAEATPATKGRVFGFHRSMDTMGAVIGPALALLYLYFYPTQYRNLFFIAVAPGLLAVLISLFLKDKGRKTLSEENKVKLFSFLRYWKTAPAAYRRVTAGILAFTLFNSSDIFLLLKAKAAGLNDTEVIGFYIFFNLVYALFSYPLGILADRLGLKRMFLAGLAAFAGVYLGMGLSENMYLIGGMFFLYGIYYAATEGISKAWISNICAPEDTATAIGTYTGFQSICALIASTLAGLIWVWFGAEATFLVTALATSIVIVYFAFYTMSPPIAGARQKAYGKRFAWLPQKKEKGERQK